MVGELKAKGGQAQKRKRIGYSKGHNGGKKPKMLQGSGKKAKIDGRMKKIFRKRADEYNSDSDDHGVVSIKEVMIMYDERDAEEVDSDDDYENEKKPQLHEEGNEGEHGEIQSGITKFSEGCRAFNLAFKKIMKRNISDNALGPVLSGHQRLVAEKLAAEEADRKVKGEAKKEKQLVKEKGHLIPESFFDAHEKFLLEVVRKGGIPLEFILLLKVNRTQMAEKGLDPSRTKDAKELSKKRKDAFFSELGRKPFSHNTASKSGIEEGPAWAPLRDSYMLINSKFKNWDKQHDNGVANDDDIAVIDSSDDDE